jgi:flagellum-specific ATP synthase
MTEEIFAQMGAVIAKTTLIRPIGTIMQIAGNTLRISGLAQHARVGDRVKIVGAATQGEVVRTSQDALDVLIDGTTEGLGLGAKVALFPRPEFAPHAGWIGRVVDPDGQPLDGRPLLPGTVAQPVSAPPPPANSRRSLGVRLSTGFAVFDTILPIVRGQRVGLFAGSGVG